MCSPISDANLAARAIQALSVATADALYAYAVTGSAFANLIALAAPHLDVFLRCFFHGKGSDLSASFG